MFSAAGLPGGCVAATGLSGSLVLAAGATAALGVLAVPAVRRAGFAGRETY